MERDQSHEHGPKYVSIPSLNHYLSTNCFLFLPLTQKFTNNFCVSCLTYPYTSFSMLLFFDFLFLFIYRFLLESAVFYDTFAFDRIWCKPVWTSIIARSDFTNSHGYAFCCPSGEHYDVAESTPASQIIKCASCSLGRYTGNQSLAPTCQGCPSGWFQPKEGQQFCYPCNPGKHQFQEGRDSCLSCGEGTFMPDATSDSVTCKFCPAGYYVQGNEATKCQACEEGKYSEEKGAASSKTCLECLRGTYSSSKAATECQPW